jgi:hypothetical protein
LIDNVSLAINDLADAVSDSAQLATQRLDISQDGFGIGGGTGEGGREVGLHAKAPWFLAAIGGVGGFVPWGVERPRRTQGRKLLELQGLQDCKRRAIQQMTIARADGPWDPQIRAKA